MAYTTRHGKLVKVKLDHWNGGRKTYQYQAPTPENPESKTKGMWLGLCNRSACLAPGANWWNTGSRAYYCEDCAMDINYDGCRRFNEPDLCHEGKPE